MPLRSHIVAVVLVLCAAALLLPTNAVAGAPVGMPPAGKLMLGVGGSAIDPPGFDTLTHTPDRHKIHLVGITWNELRPWYDAIIRRIESAQANNYRLMVYISPQKTDGSEGRTPAAVASGAADRYLLDMSNVLNSSNQYMYVRPPAEMNAYWSPWCAFNKNGSRRSGAHSTANYRKAFIRMALIARGGSVATINAALMRYGMPALSTTLTELPSSGRIAIVWNPQGRGAPNVRGNQPPDYYPGRAFVDYVANDMYEQGGRADWAANDALYARYARVHPYMMAEWAPWGYDSPTYVAKQFAWALAHPRVVALMYFNGTGKTTFRLASKPRSLAKYRQMARGTRFACPGLGPSSTTCGAHRGSLIRKPRDREH